MTYVGEIRDTKVLAPNVRFFYGIDYEQLMLAAAAAPGALCLYVVADYNHLGPRFAGHSSLNYSSAACEGMIAGAGAATAILWLIRDHPELAGEIVSAVINTIRDVTTSVPLPGGGNGETTSGKEIYDKEIEKIAEALRKLNKGELTLDVAKAVAAACVATSAYHSMSALVGVALGPAFCRKPSMAFFIVGADANEAAQHDFDAIFGNVGEGLPARPSWAVLNYTKSGKKLQPGTKIGEGQNKRWYRNLNPCKGQVEVLVTACDEYPYFSARQGSGFSSPRPSIRPIDWDDNSHEGSMLNAMRARCGFESSAPITAASNGTGGTRYLVLPMPEPGLSDVGSLLWKPIQVSSPITVGLCNRGRPGPDPGPGNS